MSKRSPFGIVFEPTNQPGWESRFGHPTRSIVMKDSIVGTSPKDHPEPYTASEVLKQHNDLKAKFVSMQVPQLLPSQILRRRVR